MLGVMPAIRFNNIITSYLVKIGCDNTITKFNSCFIVSFCHFLLNFCQTSRSKVKKYIALLRKDI